MSKQRHLGTEAERLYVQEQMTLEEIAARLDVGVRTLQNWKTEGGWDSKRAGYLRERQAFHEELYGFSRKLMHSISEDIDAGEKVDSGRLYTLARILPLIMKVKDYEEATAKSKADNEPKADGLSEDIISLIQREVLGIG